MNQSPLVSVVIPVYNAELYLTNCVSSVLQQSYQNIEVLLIDDGSSDASPDICDEVSQHDPRVIVFHTKNGGVSSARNIGISHSNGEYLLFVDNDDALPINAIEIYVFVITTEDVEIVQGKIGSLNSFDAGDSKCIPESISARTITIEEYIKDGTSRTDVWGKLYKSSVAKKYRFPEGHYSEDLYYNALYVTDDSVRTAGVLGNVSYLRYDNPRSASHLWDAGDYLDSIYVIDDIYRAVTDRTSNQSIRDQYLHLFFTQFCKDKYNIILRKGYNKKTKQIVEKIRHPYVKELRKSRLKLKNKLALYVFSRFNCLYRAWLLRFDPTMKHYERAVASGVYARR